MKRKFFTTTALLCCFVVCFAIVADLSGKWTGTFKSPDGNDFTLNYTFKVDGGKLSGTVESPQGEIPITNGTVNGSDFSFTISVNGTDIKNDGKYYAEGDSAAIFGDFGGNKFHIPLKRNTK